MNVRAIKTIAKKDLLEVMQNKSAWISMIVVPTLFVIIMPLVFILVPTNISGSADAFLSDNDLKSFLASMPPSFVNTISGLDEIQSAIVIFIGYLFAPFFLIFPIMFSSIIASESFAGEKERKTLEALLYTPASNTELFLGKSLAAFVPAVIITWVSFLIYTAVVNIASYPLFRRVWFPLPVWYPLIFWVTPALATLAIAVTVLISSKTQTFMGAYQLSASLVIVVLGLLVGQISGILYLDILAEILVGIVFWIISFGLLSICIKGFNRYRLIQGIKQ